MCACVSVQLIEGKVVALKNSVGMPPASEVALEEDLRITDGRCMGNVYV